MYTPPFNISPEAINRIAGISGLIERYALRLESLDWVRLRKANRIRTIHSSLAIEGNKLSEDDVKDIIDGKNIVAPLREIQEVKNAIKTYEFYPKLDAFRESDLLLAHSMMMEALVDNAGKYRQGEVGVFGEHGVIHVAPPAERVPALMGELFAWLKNSRDHLLIRSCVFHYEFEFIHPFIDGNGRIGRLWQSLILGKLAPVFQYLPVENMVFNNQQAYYDAISASTTAGESGPFIDFMLGEILKTLKEHQEKSAVSVPNKVPNKVPDKFRVVYPEITETAWRIFSAIRQNANVTASELSALLNISDRTIRKHILLLKEKGLIERIGSRKSGYWKTVDKPVVQKYRL